jgi:hypothetical protein
VIARAVALVALLAPASAGASTGRPVVALTASPTHVTLAGRTRHAIHVANPGATPLVVDASPAGFTLGPRGRPHVVGGAPARRAASWLRVRPSRIALAPGGAADLVLSAEPSSPATPGDHAALVLLTTRAPPGTALPVRMRVGVTVVVRVPGRIVHRLALRSLRLIAGAGGPVFRVVIANRGNVVERLRRGRVEIALRAGGRRIAELRSSPRELLPGATGILELRYRGGVRGPLTAVVSVAGSRGGQTALRRTVRVVLGGTNRGASVR